VSDAVLGEGIGSMLSCPMLSGEKVVGALYVGSRRPREFSAIEVALTMALAAQGAVAIENGRLYARLAEQNRVLEGSFAVHRALTDAALTGAGRARICTELARLLGAGVVLEQDISPPFASRYGADGAVTIGVPVEDFGRLSVCGLASLTPLQAKALEHAATVLALELVKERAQQQVEWQLQGDLLSELLDAGGPLGPSLAARARRHGIDLARAHRIVAVRSPDAVADDLLALVRRATGRGLRHRDASLVCLRGEDVVLAARDGDEDAAVRAVGAAAERDGVAVAVGISDAYASPAAERRDSGPGAAERRGPAPGAATRRSPVAGAGLAPAYRQAAACARLALARGDGVVRADQLGPLRFLLDAPDVEQVRAVVAEQLGPLVAHEGRADLLATLRAFVAADGNVAATAEACFVHKNTLRYRLTRLTEVLGRDPADPDAKFHLRMAFDLVDLFAGMGIDVLPAPEGRWRPAAVT
jgi:sugar diacid utilization regulator